MTLRVTFLGTSAAIPTTERNPSGILINREGDRLLFDAGEGTQRQMMRYGTGFTVSAIFLTHLHGDHVLGLPGLLQTWSFQDRERPVDIHTPAGTADRLSEFLFSLEERPGYPVRIHEVEPGATARRWDDYEVRAFRTDHRTRAVGYALVEEDRKGRFDRARAEELGIPVGPKFSTLHDGDPVELADGTVIIPEQVVGDPRPGRRVVYTGDTLPTKTTVAAAASADLLIHDATFTSEHRKRARETAHATAREAGRIAADADAKRLALTHISSRYTGRPSEHETEAAEVYDGTIILAQDGRVVEVPYPEE